MCRINTFANRLYTSSTRVITLICIAFGYSIAYCNAQTETHISLTEAIERGVTNYGILRAKQSYAQASVSTTDQVKRAYLPNLNLSAQQDYGTVNGQNGPLFGLGGLGVASSGLPLPQQNWNAAFGALYLVNVNWEFFTFGRIKQQINVARADAQKFQTDYEQELFQHKIKIAAAYLNLLASQRLLVSQQKNLERAEVFFQNVSERAKNGLLPGVDSTMALAEMSRARILLTQIRQQVKNQNNELLVVLGESTPVDYTMDTTFISKVPTSIVEARYIADTTNHPTRKYFQSLIYQSKEQEKLAKREYFPTLNMFGVFQTRASGFHSDYAVDQTSYTHNYLNGISPTRQNYLFGVGLVWNLTTILRSSKKLEAQKLTTLGREEEYRAVNTELKVRDDAANAQINFALQNYNEAPLQVEAAQQAYLQRVTLYQNGLANLTDVTTTLFTLNRAETDRDIAFTNVWQALLLKAAAAGNFDLFISEF